MTIDVQYYFLFFDEGTKEPTSPKAATSDKVAVWPISLGIYGPWMSFGRRLRLLKVSRLCSIAIFY